MVGGAEIPLIRLSHTEESCDGVAPEKNTKEDEDGGTKKKKKKKKRSDAAKCHKPERNS